MSKQKDCLIHLSKWKDIRRFLQTKQFMLRLAELVQIWTQSLQTYWRALFR